MSPTLFKTAALALGALANFPCPRITECPAADNCLYHFSGVELQVNCGTYYHGADLQIVPALSIGECMDACAANTGCVAANYLAYSCSLKSSILSKFTEIDMIGVTVGSRNLSPPPPPKRPPPPKQLIKNHKFEEGEGFVVPHWGIQRNYGYCAWGIFPNNGYSGNRSLQFFSADMRQQQWTARLTQDVTVVPFSSYEVRIWAKYAYSGCGIVFEYNDIGLGAWALRDEYRLYQAVIPENATTYEAGRLVFQIRCINEGRGGAFIDAITMTEIGSKQPPPPLPPLGSTSEFGN